MVPFHQNERLAALALEMLETTRPDLVPLAHDLARIHLAPAAQNHAYLHAGLVLLSSQDSSDAISAISRMAKVPSAQARGILVASVDASKTVFEPYADMLAEKGLIRIKGHYIAAPEALREDSRFLHTLRKIDPHYRPIAEEAFSLYDRLSRKPQADVSTRMLGYIGVQLMPPGKERVAAFNALSIEQGDAHKRLLTQSSRAILKAADRLGIVIPSYQLERGADEKTISKGWKPYELPDPILLKSDRNFHKSRPVRP